MMNFYEEPEAMKELINYLADWEVEYADVVCAKLHPDAVFLSLIHIFQQKEDNSEI